MTNASHACEKAREITTIMQHIDALYNDMTTYFRQGHADLDIVPATLMLSLTPMSSMSHKDNYEGLRQRMAPYIPVAAATPAADTSLDGKVLMEVLATKEGHQEVKNLHYAKVCNDGVFMAGNVNMATGIITTLTLAKLFQAHTNLLEIKTKDERVEAFGHHLNTNNKLRGTSPWCQHCCMPQADPVLMPVLVSARWPQVAISDLSKD